MPPTLASASCAWSLTDDRAVPSKGSGPIYCGDERWIQSFDILACNRASAPPPASWKCDTYCSAPSPLQLRPYQQAAVEAANPEGCRLRSGVFDIGCGLGKTFVGGELIRRSGCFSVVVTQHVMSVTQWVDFLRDRVGLRSVLDGTERWVPGDPMPDAVVTTYHTIVRIAQNMDSIASGEPFVKSSSPCSSLLLWSLFCRRFGVLILDEAHVAAADQFFAATRLKCSVAYGLTGSLVREDNLLPQLLGTVGAVLHSYHRPNLLRYDLHRVPVSEALQSHLATLARRGVLEEATRALNPFKVALLQRLLSEELAHDRVIVFCDSKLASKLLARFLGLDLLITGSTRSYERAQILKKFSNEDEGRLMCTRVCDAAIDFPDGCVVVQYHVCSGSRQQEAQRCGRGTRSGVAASASRMVHLVNDGTSEESFVKYRVGYIRDTREHVEVRTHDSAVRPTRVQEDLVGQVSLHSGVRMKRGRGQAR